MLRAYEGSMSGLVNELLFQYFSENEGSISYHEKKESRKSGAAPRNIKEPKPLIDIPGVFKGTDNVIGRPRTYRDVYADIKALEESLSKERQENEFNQDPEFWDTFNEKEKKKQELWEEYHRLKGE